MATAEEQDESIFERLPEGVTKGQAKQAWRARELIWRLTDDKTPMADVARTVRAPATAVEWVIQGRTGPAEMPHRSTPDEGAGHATPTGGVDEGGKAPPPTEVPKGAMTGPPDRTEERGGGTPPSTKTEKKWEPTEEEKIHALGSDTADLSRVGAPVSRSGIAGDIESPDQLGLLKKIMMAYGLQEPQANGIAFTFSIEAEMYDLDTLRRLLVTAGKNNYIVNSVVHSWEVVLKRMGSAAPATTKSRSLQERIDAAQKGLGMKSGPGAQTPEDMTMDDIERRKAQIELKTLEMGYTEREAALAERERALRTTTGGPATPGDDGKVDLMVSIGGSLPQKLRVPADQAAYYDRWIVKSGPPSESERPKDEMPAWAKALQDQNKALQDRLERQDRERDDERRRREEDERLDRRLAPIEKALTDRPGPSAESQELKALRDEMRLRDQRDTDSRFDRLERLYAQGRSPEEADKILDAESKRMSG